jgi:hypothetical protein
MKGVLSQAKMQQGVSALHLQPKTLKASGGTDNTYMVTVTATHATDDDSVIETATVTVTVTDVDEPPTEIRETRPPTPINEVDSTSDSIPTDPVTAMGVYMSTDPDGHIITWSISGSDSSDFTINSQGNLILSVVAPDYETKSSYSVIVTATDAGGQKATRTVTVPVTNVNESGTLSPTSVRVGQTVTATVDDPDGVKSYVSAVWTRTGTTVGTSRTYTVVEDDAAEGTTLSLVVRYLDGVGNAIRELPGTVAVLAAENAAPVLTDPSESVTLNENVTDMPDLGPHNVGNYAATDDKDVADDLTWDLEGTDASLFSRADDGTLSLNADLDYETKSSYAVTVKVTDTDGESHTVSVTVTITNLQEGDGTLSPTSVRVGQTVTATVDDPDGVKSYVSAVWTRTGTTVGTSRTYTVVEDDAAAGTTLMLAVRYLDGEGAMILNLSHNVTVLATENAAPVLEGSESVTLDENDTDMPMLGPHPSMRAV